MPRNKEAFRLTAEFIERIHDQGLAIGWPGIEPVRPNDCLDRNLLQSAAEQPFQGGFGVDYFYPTICDKAACLFFSIAGGHIFGNGNKRTGVMALDMFLKANSIYLLIPNEDMYQLAIRTATYRTRSEDHEQVKAGIAKTIRANSVEFKLIRKVDPDLWKKLQRIKRGIRSMNIS